MPASSSSARADRPRYDALGAAVGAALQELYRGSSAAAGAVAANDVYAVGGAAANERGCGSSAGGGSGIPATHEFSATLASVGRSSGSTRSMLSSSDVSEAGSLPARGGSPGQLNLPSATALYFDAEHAARSPFPLPPLSCAARIRVKTSFFGCPRCSALKISNPTTSVALYL